MCVRSSGWKFWATARQTERDIYHVLICDIGTAESIRLNWALFRKRISVYSVQHTCCIFLEICHARRSQWTVSSVPSRSYLQEKFFELIFSLPSYLEISFLSWRSTRGQSSVLLCSSNTSVIVKWIFAIFDGSKDEETRMQVQRGCRFPVNFLDEKREYGNLILQYRHCCSSFAMHLGFPSHVVALNILVYLSGVVYPAPRDDRNIRYLKILSNNLRLSEYNIELGYHKAMKCSNELRPAESSSLLYYSCLLFLYCKCSGPIDARSLCKYTYIQLGIAGVYCLERGIRIPLAAREIMKFEIAICSSKQRASEQ